MKRSRLFFGAVLSLSIFFCSIAFSEAPPSPKFLEIKDAHQQNLPCIEYVTKNDKQYCTVEKAGYAQKQSSVFNEKTNLFFDNRNWIASWGKDEPAITTVEYLIKGDNIDHWTELVTSQFLPGLQNRTTPKIFADSTMAHMKQSGLSPLFTTHLETPKDFIFEFQISSPTSVIQDEIQRIFATDKGIYIIHYVIKKADMGEQERQNWIQLLKKATPK